jgi:A/G-specific adenine glycosylase
MLQQTRVAVVVPYFERFVERFPTVYDLAAACESDVLNAWSGLGYYSRARNLRKAAMLISERGGFPENRDALLLLPGIGDYTAAAIASIAFGKPHAAIDGNALRVLSRIMADGGDIGSPETRARMEAFANELLDRRRAGDFNQAVMELGATVCLPKAPLCNTCPAARHCQAHIEGREQEFPVKLRRTRRAQVHETLYYVERKNEILFWQRNEDSRRLAGFWELPGPRQLKRVMRPDFAGQFSHAIVNTTYHFRIVRASVRSAPAELSWVSKSSLHGLPLSTTAKKALRCVERV